MGRDVRLLTADAEIEKLNEQIAEMDRMTQENGALVEEAGTAANTLCKQAAGHSAVLGSFKL